MPVHNLNQTTTLYIYIISWMLSRVSKTRLMFYPNKVLFMFLLRTFFRSEVHAIFRKGLCFCGCCYIWWSLGNGRNQGRFSRIPSSLSNRMRHSMHMESNLCCLAVCNQGWIHWLCSFVLVPVNHLMKKTGMVWLLEKLVHHKSCYCLGHPWIFRFQHDTNLFVLKRYTACLFLNPIFIYSGGRLNKKDGLTRYGDSHVKDMTS